MQLCLYFPFSLSSLSFWGDRQENKTKPQDTKPYYYNTHYFGRHIQMQETLFGQFWAVGKHSFFFFLTS